MVTDIALLRLLQLISPSLPIGMYCYSQGIEMAVEEGLCTNETQTSEWIEGVMARCLACVDLPVFIRLYSAWEKDDNEQIIHWSRILTASRETAELRAEDRQTGQALARLLYSLEIEKSEIWMRSTEATLVNMFALASVAWGVPVREAAIGYLWSWLENQVLCAVKLVPLGQVSGQRLLVQLAESIPELVARSFVINDEDIGGSTFGFALMSSRHERQYSRLFRS
ncbi:MAG TPA: urease accessory protein UreF [Methylococcaceae bacterium]|nr:urease accessory protein UreF [Methylococcaceae bacterium]